MNAASVSGMDFDGDIVFGVGALRGTWMIVEDMLDATSSLGTLAR